ncbi:MAG: DsbA family protein [Proteobacteria bacterium]|jgi:putative protein-disulfide isomerase|nr:DsbA family protein [Pseudomonadota bacterium]
MPQPILWYFADPMCSWCWGFTPVIEQIKQHYDDRLKVALVMGGLRPGTTESVTLALREDLLHHWDAVQRMSGAEFRTEGALPDGFVYDTEPAARAVITVGGINPVVTFLYYKSVQAAFYTQNVDITQTNELTQLAHNLGIDPQQFRKEFESEDARQKTRQHFAQTRAYGVQGFPTLIAENTTAKRVVTRGYGNYADLRKTIDDWLSSESGMNGC